VYILHHTLPGAGVRVDVEIKALFPHEAFVESEDTWYIGCDLSHSCCNVRVRRNVGKFQDQWLKASASSTLDLPECGVGAQAFVDLTDVIGNSRAQNGRFFGYVQGPGEPIAVD